MEGTSHVPEPVVIGQDERSELRIQAVAHGPRRYLDLRIWQHAVSGMSPSGNSLLIDASTLTSLQSGIEELLDASGDGTQPARVVWDGEDGRRLRAEIEPFGTHYVAKLGFWQRVRDSWRPADEGLVLDAARLRALHNVLAHLTPWLMQSDQPPAAP